jgi:hypothetical protein
VLPSFNRLKTTYEKRKLSCARAYLTLILLMWRKGWAPNSIPIYIQQDAKLHSLFISGNCSTCFGWYFHPSSGAHTTTSTASGICHTVTAICRYRGRVGTGLSVLWMAYAQSTGHAVAQLVQAPLYKSEGRGFDSRWCHWNFSLTSFRPHYGPGLTQLLTQMSTRNISWG